MNLFVSQHGTLILGEGEVPDDNENVWVKVAMNANHSPLLINLSEDMTLVKFHNKADGVSDVGVLVVFPYNRNQKPRTFKLHDLPDTNKKRELLHAIFAILLDFDNGRLSNRNRNFGLLAVRPLLPDVVRGYVGKETPDALRFYLNKDKLSIINGKSVIFRLERYIQLSNKVKDSIS
jgi:hypothetical protein